MKIEIDADANELAVRLTPDECWQLEEGLRGSPTKAQRYLRAILHQRRHDLFNSVRKRLPETRNERLRPSSTLQHGLCESAGSP